jgi:hypothetical protein
MIPARGARLAGTDGDYFSKSNAEELFDVIYSLMNESNPSKYPR